MLLRPIEILIAEDSQADALFAKEAFEQIETKCNIHVVTDGQQALDYLNKESSFSEAASPDIMFLDLNLPKVAGLDVLKHVKSNDNLQSIPVIIISGSDSPKDIQECYKIGANAYVPKQHTFTDMVRFAGAIEEFWFSSAKFPNQF